MFFLLPHLFLLSLLKTDLYDMVWYGQTPSQPTVHWSKVIFNSVLLL